MPYSQAEHHHHPSPPTHYKGPARFQYFIHICILVYLQVGKPVSIPVVPNSKPSLDTADMVSSVVIEKENNIVLDFSAKLEIEDQDEARLTTSNISSNFDSDDLSERRSPPRCLPR